MLEHAKVIWPIRMFLLRNQRHCTHILCWNRQKVIWLIRKSFLRNQRHCTHILCWNMQRSFDWSEHSSWEIRGTALTRYVGKCKGHLTNQNVLPEKSEALHSHPMLEHTKGHLTDQNIIPGKSEALHSQPMLEHAKVIWLIKTSFLRNQRHCTHILCWNMQRSFDWSEHSSWEIRGTVLTSYVGICKSHLTDQNIFPGKSEALHSQAMLEYAKVIWLVRNAIDNYIKITYWLDIQCT